jgi:hypothetical protein
LDNGLPSSYDSKNCSSVEYQIAVTPVDATR